MNSKKSKKLRKLANLIGNGKSKEEVEVIYKNMKSTYKEQKKKL